MKKRIALLSPELAGKGGMETAYINLYKVLKNDADYSINFIFMNGMKDKSFLENFPSKSVTYYESCSVARQFFNLLKLMINGKYDAYIITSKRLIILASYIRKMVRVKVPIISWMHFSVSKEGIYLNLAKYGDAHLAISRDIYSQIEKMGVDQSKIYYLPNYVEASSQTIGLPKDNKYVYVGRIEFLKQKNLKELIDGLARLKYQWTIDIYGDGTDLQRCKDYINSSYPSICSRFKWKGWKNNPWENIDKATALLLTSKMEGMPMVLIESMARGLPVISSNCPTGPRDVIKDGINGYMYKMNDLSDFVTKVTKLTNKPLDRGNVKSSVKCFGKEAFLKNLKTALNEQLNR